MLRSCEIVAPDGAGYPDMPSLVDDTLLLQPGESLLGSDDITTPGKEVTPRTYTRSGPPWLWIGVGAGLAIMLVAGLLVFLARRRKREPGSGDVEDQLGS